jgi:hypothetical protein
MPECQREGNVKYEKKNYDIHTHQKLLTRQYRAKCDIRLVPTLILLHNVTTRKVNTKCRNMPRLSINSNSRFTNLYTPCHTTCPLINITGRINSYLQSLTRLSEKLPRRFTSKPTSTQSQAQKQLPSSDHFLQQPLVPTNSKYGSKFLQIFHLKCTYFYFVEQKWHVRGTEGCNCFSYFRLFFLFRSTVFPHN